MIKLTGVVATFLLLAAAGIPSGRTDTSDRAANVSTSTVAPTPTTTAETRSSDKPVNLHRYLLREPRGITDHFYTTNLNEPTGADSIYEGVVGLVFPSPTTGTVPLHRYYNHPARDHLYTINWAELGGGKNDYVYEGIQCYVFPEPTDDTLPVYRYYNSKNKDHFYTHQFEELRGGKNGWVLESISGYVLKVRD